MKNIINFIKGILGFENAEESMIGLASFKTSNNFQQFSVNNKKDNRETSLTGLLTRRQFQ